MTENRLASGWPQGAVHVLPRRVYWGDTDGTGIVCYANYLKYTEPACTDLPRIAGVEQRAFGGRSAHVRSTAL